MTISRDEALQAMAQMERTEARSVDARIYRTTGDQLIMWGGFWVLGYTLSGVWPHKAGLFWPPLVLVGMIAGFFLARRNGATSVRKDHLSGWRWSVQALAFTLFIVGTYVLFPITSFAQPLAFPTLVIAFVYAIVGGARLTRMLWIGAALFVLTLVGVVFFKPFLAFWLAAAGGGALILGGLWLRKA